jgi:hypothetical protein
MKISKIRAKNTCEKTRNLVRIVRNCRTKLIGEEIYGFRIERGKILVVFMKILEYSIEGE